MKFKKSKEDYYEEEYIKKDKPKKKPEISEEQKIQDQNLQSIDFKKLKSDKEKTVKLFHFCLKMNSMYSIIAILHSISNQYSLSVCWV